MNDLGYSSDRCAGFIWTTRTFEPYAQNLSAIAISFIFYQTIRNVWSFGLQNMKIENWKRSSLGANGVLITDLNIWKIFYRVCMWRTWDWEKLNFLLHSNLHKFEWEIAIDSLQMIIFKNVTSSLFTSYLLC